ncbi:MAG: hypothetical protein K1V76_07590 [Candidatus Amulumruptor sp.]
MDENEFSDLFASYNPELSSDKLFMLRLQANLRAVSLVKEQVHVMRRKNRLAVIVAAITGFLCGILFAIYYPAFFTLLKSLFAASTVTAKIFADYGNVAAWGIICCVTGIAAYSAYDIALLATKKNLTAMGLYH